MPQDSKGFAIFGYCWHLLNNYTPQPCTNIIVYSELLADNYMPPPQIPCTRSQIVTSSMLTPIIAVACMFVSVFVLLCIADTSVKYIGTIQPVFPNWHHPHSQHCPTGTSQMAMADRRLPAADEMQCEHGACSYYYITVPLQKMWQIATIISTRFAFLNCFP